MTETLRQSLSALVDQEATEFEARKILDGAKTRGDLKEYWASCQVISSTMRGDEMLGTTLLDRINAELDGVAEAKPIIDAQQGSLHMLLFSHPRILCQIALQH